MKPAESARTQDDIVDELLEEALAGYEGLVPDDVMAEIRASLGDLLYAHPDGQRILRQLESDPMVDGSGDVFRPDLGEEGADPARQTTELRPRKARS